MNKLFKYSFFGILVLFLILSSCGLNNITQNSNISNNTGSDIKLGSLDFEYEEGKVLVGYENREEVNKIVEALNGKIAVDLPQIKMVSIKFNGTVEEAYEKILKLGLKGIRYVEPSYKRYIIDPKPVDNNMINKNNETSLNSTNPRDDEEFSKYLWGLEALNVKDVWNMGYTGDGVIVAVVDSGVDGTHPDLKGQVIEGYRPKTGEILPAGTDSSFGGAHGTHVAGTIAASDNSLGIIGVAPDAKIMPIVIFDVEGYVGDDAVADGIIWAVDHGADILQNSWGGWGYSYTLKEAFDYALDRDVVVTVSAGNDHTDQHVHYPSGYPGIIQVAAVEFNGGKYRTTWFSNRSDAITVGAPGVDILSTVPQATALGYEGGELADSFGGLYAFYQGTSMACPHVSGVVALLKEKYPDAKVWQIRKLIEQGAVDIDKDGYDHDSGFGLVNAKNSINLSLPTEGGATFNVEALDSWENPIPGVFVTLKRVDGEGGDYFAKTDLTGIAHFSNIDAGKYEVIVGGPDSNDRSYSGDGYLGNSFSTRREEERQYVRTVNVTADATETFTFTSTFKVEFDEPVIDLGQATLTVDSVFYELITGIRGSYLSETFVSNMKYDFSSIADLVYLRLERSNVGATCTVNGTVTLNGTEIPVTAVFASEDATLSTVVDDVYGKPYWLIFGN
ncbi:putative subtilase-type serine protease [Thermosipho africanus H17ap60334]|uniref:S8 family serine peptidase n=1 Tax=Thermosipho africanus TaxID=2421 RepID=UPI00028DFF95|nr:S8 family serine peptidase [Thermosipho africanus]EKF49459.1 putative subtilase-type serine protease [Thermosipho africanus H17ap60334]